MRDRDHPRALGEPLQRRRDRVRRLAADARVDLAEDHRLATADAAIASATWESHTTGGASRRPTEREPAVRTDQEDGLVGAGRAGVALAHLDAELALTHPDAAEPSATASAKGPAAIPRAARSASASSPARASAAASASSGGDRVEPASSADSSARAAAARASRSP